MENARSKAEIMKPALLKAGIPLVISVAGFIYALITVRRNSNSGASNSEILLSSIETGSNEESFHSFNSTSFDFQELEEMEIVTNTQFVNFPENWEIQDKFALREEIFVLKCQVENLQERERELGVRFLQYCELKEEEATILGLQNMLNLEIARIEFLGREVSSLEAENQRLDDLVAEIFRVLEQLENSRLQKGLLQNKVKKLSRKTKKQSRLLREIHFKVEAKESKVSRILEELERVTSISRRLEGEAQDQKLNINQLEMEKGDLLNKLQSTENSASSSSKIEAEGITVENYNQLVNELEQLQKDRAAELQELIFLRWNNACLKHELARSHEQQEQNQENRNHPELDFKGEGESGEYGSEHEMGGSVLEHGRSCLGATGVGHACSRRPRFLHKLRRWVEGGEKMKEKIDERGKQENNCCGRHSVSDGTEEQMQVHPWRSCSSA